MGNQRQDSGETKTKLRQLHQIAIQLSQMTEVEAACECMVQAAQCILHFKYCNVGLADGQWLRVRAMSPGLTKTDVPVNRGLAGQMLRQGRSFMVEDAQTDPIAKPKRTDYRAGLSVPIGKIGVFQAISTEVGVFDEDDLQLAELLAAHLLAALERINHTRDLAEQRRSQEQMLRRERDFMFRIFESLHQYVIVEDASHRIEFVNRAAREGLNLHVGASCQAQIGERSSCQFERVSQSLDQGAQVVECTFEIQGRTLEGIASKIAGDDGSSSFLTVLDDVTERKEAEAKLNQLTFYDRVTGIYNRTFFEEELCRLGDSRHHPIAIILADINGLKMVNDGFGHAYGDRLLRRIAKLLKDCSRVDDIVARWGGDEFVILMLDAGEEVAELVSQRIHAACTAAKADPVQLSVAVGYAVKQTKEQTLEKTIQQAEASMYKNKMMSAESSRHAVVESMRRALEAKSHETKFHVENLQRICRRFGVALGLSPMEQNDLALFSLLHDVGQVVVTNRVLCKRGRLNEREWKLIKSHPEVGFRIAAASPELVSVANYILAHHECWDGTGYPKGLKGEEIPRLARLFSIVDAYDAMTNNRPYREQITHKQALEKIAEASGTHFDPSLTQVFLQTFRDEIPQRDEKEKS